MAVKALPCPTLLRLLLDYDPETGTLTWKPRPRYMFSSLRGFSTWNARYAGRLAFTATRHDGYKVGAVFGRMVEAHRVLWALHTGAWPVDEIDHIDGTKFNGIHNLREATRRQNLWNRGASKSSSSKYVGVCWNNKRAIWEAKCKAAKKSFLGYYENEADAAKAYDAAAKREFGQWARLNFPERI